MKIKWAAILSVILILAAILIFLLVPVTLTVLAIIIVFVGSAIVAAIFSLNS